MSGNQLIIDCGIKYEKLVVDINWEKPCSCIISHEHTDHFNKATISKLKLFGIDVFAKCDMKNGKTFSVNGFNILPIELPHGEDCTSMSFIIFNYYEGKSIFFATDCTKLPRISDREFNLIMVENNYDELTAFKNRINGNAQGVGYMRHLSTEYVLKWLSIRMQKAKNILITHLSNSGNIQVGKLRELYAPYAEKIFIAKENLSIEF